MKQVSKIAAPLSQKNPAIGRLTPLAAHADTTRGAVAMLRSRHAAHSGPGLVPGFVLSPIAAARLLALPRNARFEPC
jgi:hypothetical protein